MLMAAGLGTRLRPFSEMVPKPLLPLMGVPMAQYAVDYLVEAGVKRIVANIHHRPEIAKPGFESLDLRGTEMKISDESQQLLGSAGGIRQALPRLGGGPFFLVNADVLCEADLSALAARHLELRRKHGVVLTLTVFPKGPAGGAYREILFDRESGLISGLTEPVRERPFFASVAVIEPEALAQVPPAGPAEFVPTILLPAIQSKRAGVFTAEGAWYDIGSPALWLDAHLGLIDGMESGRTPEIWRRRIERHNRKLAPGVWVSKDSRSGTEIDASSWQGPAYWSADGQDVLRGPRHLGPRAVLYGDSPNDAQSLAGGIGFRNLWV